MATTFPLQVVEAERWLQDPAHKDLKGDALVQALAALKWDPSVKSLVPFPQVLAQQRQSRLDAAGRLRVRHAAAGRLRQRPAPAQAGAIQRAPRINAATGRAHRTGPSWPTNNHHPARPGQYGLRYPAITRPSSMARGRILRIPRSMSRPRRATLSAQHSHPAWRSERAWQ